MGSYPSDSLIQYQCQWSWNREVRRTSHSFNKDSKFDLILMNLIFILFYFIYEFPFFGNWNDANMFYAELQSGFVGLGYIVYCICFFTEFSTTKLCGILQIRTSISSLSYNLCSSESLKLSSWLCFLFDTEIFIIYFNSLMKVKEGWSCFSKG